MGRLRHLIFELRPTSLDRGLAPALREYAETVGAEEAGPEYHVEDSMEAEPSPEIRGAVYRIVVEALRNVRSHARAHRVDIAVATEEGGVQATVRDDGVGFDVDEVARSPGHVGLTTMRDRAETLGGRFEVQSEPGRGSTVTIWVPEAGEDGP
jgi:signal transduction histidine kinase